ncbi:aldo/keto reductase [Saccharopolyspora sp. WRP15-2]|uniref:Aldo/keto reductase n=1 Tax=Saccharopolyspora oryzae TaxID=2997343 RepID=A0ABT4US60_9PSEU|nr:aldo/keto reductase [Saccharopolyspora oryzae]MDA3624561.1 aldo/keto reductase [Saccharopolyspora oryzae]
METRRLGGDGPALSVVGLGCNNFGMKLDQQASAEVIGAALDAGITHLDTAEMYGEGRSEEYIGAALGARRDEVVIATKFLPRPQDEPYAPGALRKRILDACEGSLRRLRTDRIDLYYQHYPDPEAPVDEALETLDELVQHGKVLHIASSNVSAEQIATAANVSAERSLPRFCGTQIEWNLLSREVEQSIVPAARDNGLGVVPYFPLASGMLTGKYRRGSDFPAGSRFDAMSYFADRFANDESFDRVEALTAFAEERGHSILELAVAWLAAQDGVASVITGATTPDQARANAAAANWTLTSADLTALP